MAMGTDGSVVMAGYTNGGLANERNFGEDGYGSDFAAVKLDANGTLLWTWQVIRPVLCENETLPQQIFSQPSPFRHPPAPKSHKALTILLV